MVVKTLAAILVGFFVGVISAAGISSVVTRIRLEAERARLDPIEEELENAGIPT